MILVTLGTQTHQFPRILEMVDQLNEDFEIHEDIMVQSGETTYEMKNNKKFVEQAKYFDNFDELVQKCDLLITHGGVGSIIEALQNKKVVFAMARTKDKNEHVDDHQSEITNKLAGDNLIKEFSTYDELKANFNDYLNNNLKLEMFETTNEQFNKELTKEINALLENSKNK